MKNTSLLKISFLSVFLPPSLAFAAFSDVPGTHPNNSAIQWAQSQEIVNGYADGSFRPDANVNRAEFTKIVIGANFTPAAVSLCDPGSMYSYPDASRSDWYSPYLCLASQHQIIKGYEDGTFRPEHHINFAEAAKIVATISQYRNGVRTAESVDFSVLPGQEWYEPYTEFLLKEGAKPSSIRSNGQLVTRGEMAEMMYRLSDSFHTPDVAQDDWKTYEDVDGIFTLQLPSSWLLVGPYEGIYSPFEKLRSDRFYTSPDKIQSILLRVLKKDDVDSDAVLHIALEGLVQGDYRLQSRQEDGYKVHIVLVDDIDANGYYYTAFENDEDGTVVVIGDRTSGTITTAIQQSFRFIPKDLLR